MVQQRAMTTGCGLGRSDQTLGKKKITRNIAQHWTGLSRGVVEPPTLEGFKTWLSKATAHII